MAISLFITIAATATWVLIFWSLSLYLELYFILPFPKKKGSINQSSKRSPGYDSATFYPPPLPQLPTQFLSSTQNCQTVAIICMNGSLKKKKVQTKIVKRSGFSEKKKLGFCLWYMNAQRRGLRDVIFTSFLRPLPLTPPSQIHHQGTTMMNP